MPKKKLTVIEQCRNACKTAARNRYERHYHPTNPFRRHHMIVDAVSAFLIAALLLVTGYISVIYQRAVQQQTVEVRLQTNTRQIESGDMLTLHVEVVNNGRQALRDAKLRLPETPGFVASQGNNLDLGTIAGHETRGIDFSGIAIAENGASLPLTAVLTYNTSLGLRAEELGSISIPVNGSHLSASWQLPESLAVGKTFPFTLTVTNNAGTTFDNVIVQPNFPPDWETISETLASDPATSAWTIDRLGGLERIVIEGQARLRAAFATSVDIGVNVYAAPKGAPFLQTQAIIGVPTFLPKVALRLVSVPTNIALGETAAITVEITNNEAFALEQARFDVHADERLIDGVTNGVLAVPVPSLAAQTTGRQTIALAFRPTVSPQNVFGEDGAGFPLVAEFHYEHNGQLITVPLESRRLPIRTDLGLQAAIRFANAEGEQLGTGPWPPRAGEKTTVWVFLQPVNRFNVVENVVVTAKLAQTLRPTGRQSVTAGSAMSVDAAGNLVWRVGSLADYRSVGMSLPSGAIEVEITPTADDMSVDVLLSKALISGFDTAARVQISATAPDLAVADVLAR